MVIYIYLLFALLFNRYQTWFDIFNFDNNHIYIGYNVPQYACNNNIKVNVIGIYILLEKYCC